MDNIDNSATFRKAVANGINLFTGAGFSLLAKDREGKEMPTGSGLASELIKEFERPDLKGSGLEEISTILSSIDKARFDKYIEERFTVNEYSPLYNSLDRDYVNIKNIFTTNIDDLIYKIFEDSNYNYINDVDIRGATQNDPQAIDIYTLHGNVRKEQREYRFSSTDIAASFEADKDRWYHLSNIMSKYPTLFWGHSISSSGILRAVSQDNRHKRSIKDIWTTYHPEKSDKPEEYYKALGFNLIRLNTKGLLRLFGRMKDSDYDNRKEKRSNKFTSISVPDISDVAKRPIVDFYLGGAPTWYDILTEQVYRTRYYDTVRDELDRGKSLILTGVPACGKTTLMMQVSHGYSFKGKKLVLDSPTPSKAKWITKNLDSQEVVIFFDDFTDSLNAFEILLDHDNIQIVGCDRKYNLDRVVSALDNYDIIDNVINITDLNERDIQNIISYIPKQIKLKEVPESYTEGQDVPSVFDVVESNITTESLRKRFSGVIADLKDSDKKLLDFLLVTCYVRKCRTSISMSMLIAFFRNRIDSYDRIYEIKDTIGKIVSNYSAHLDNDDIDRYSVDLDYDREDHYVPRSKIISDAVIEQAPRESLQRVIQDFHTKISPKSIHRYDTFSRRAYDHDLISRVFTDPEEGIKFYRHILNRDDSPYILQQGSLYLNELGYTDKSFEWMDKALKKTSRKNNSILNSYAGLLFGANIDKIHTNETARSSINKSMRILEECHEEDKNNAYHVTLYAKQTIKLSETKSPQDVMKYIKNSYYWLDNLKDKYSWNDELSSLFEEIKRKVRFINASLN